MNLILFEPDEIGRPLPRTDRRARHVMEVLRRQAGEKFDVGITNGPRGRAMISGIGVTVLELTFEWEASLPPQEPITLVAGLPRPQTARDILRDATALGIGALHFVQTEKGDPNYARSTLWSSGEWRRQILAGAEQAFTTRLPSITFDRTLHTVLGELAGDTTRVALDNYEANTALSACPIEFTHSVVVAIGGERGWSAGDRGALRDHGFQFVHLGPRVLRTETACTVALAIIRSKLNLM